MSPLDRQGNYVPGDVTRPDAAVASAARTTTGTSAAFSTGSADSLEGTLTVTAASGTTPTLDVTLETSIDGGTTYDTVGAFAQKTAAGADGHVFGPLGDTCRWRWTIAGTTPSFTFTVDVEANN
jgi:hypothetical protein